MKDITGQRFGKLIAIKRTEDKITAYGNVIPCWHCKCDCGNEKDITYNSLVYDKTQSCGCLSKENVSKKNKKYNNFIFYDELGLCYTNDYKDCWYFDAEDYDKLYKYYWHTNGKDYAMAKEKNNLNNIYMHRILMNCDDPNIEIDHINHNRHDNRKSNLRKLSPSENQHTKGKNKNNSTGYTGVSYCKRDKVYISQICKNGNTYRKTFSTLEEALKWRINKSLELYGEKSPYNN